MEIFRKYLQENYFIITVFYIPLKFLLFNLITLLIIMLIVEIVYNRKKRCQNSIDLCLSSSLVFKLIFISQFIPLVICIFFIAFKIDLIHGSDMVKIIKFSANKINFMIMSTIWYIFLFLVALYILFQPKLKKCLKLCMLSPKDFKTAIQYIVLGLAAVYLPIYIYPSIFNNRLLDTYLEVGYKYNPKFITFLIIINLIIVPFGEEILYRGIIYTAIKERLSFVVAFVLQTVLFAIIHSNMFFAFYFAIISTYIYEKTKSLYPSIGFHFITNLIGYVMFFI